MIRLWSLYTLLLFWIDAPLTEGGRGVVVVVVMHALLDHYVKTKTTD